MPQSDPLSVKLGHYPFKIELYDLSIPTECPLLGIPIKRGRGKIENCSPSLDRIIPHLGYVTGNIRVISWRANSLKKDASLEEMELLVKKWRELDGAK